MESDDLDLIVTELNAGASQPVRDSNLGRLNAWLEQVVAQGVRDPLLVAGAPPCVRISGAVVPLVEGPLDGEEIAAAVSPALTPHARQSFRQVGNADASLRAPDLGRFRINLHRERGRTAAAIRRLPTTVPALSSLGL